MPIRLIEAINLCFCVAGHLFSEPASDPPTEMVTQSVTDNVTEDVSTLPGTAVDDIVDETTPGLATGKVSSRHCLRRVPLDWSVELILVT